jgi:hypothetical protein
MYDHPVHADVSCVIKSTGENPTMKRLCLAVNSNFEATARNLLGGKRIRCSAHRGIISTSVRAEDHLFCHSCWRRLANSSLLLTASPRAREPPSRAKRELQIPCAEKPSHTACAMYNNRLYSRTRDVSSTHVARWM